MEFSHAHNPGSSGGADGQGTLNINYGEIRSIGDYLWACQKEMHAVSIAGKTSEQSGYTAYDDYESIAKKLSSLEAVHTMGILGSYVVPGWNYRSNAGHNLYYIAAMLWEVARLCEEGERKAIGHNYSHTTMHHYRGDTSSVAGFAAGYYQQAVADRDEAERQSQQKSEADANKAAKEAAILALIGQLCPETADELQWMMWDAQMQEAIDYYRNGEGNNPELADMLEKEWEAKKKAREEAKKAAAELGATAEEGLGLGGGSDFGLGGGSGLGSDFGGGGGGGGDLGGFGGFDDASIDGGSLGSDWGSEDWASDMLEDALDTGELMDASDALDSITGSGLEGALGTSLEDVAGAVDEGTTGFWAEHGAQVAEVASRYGAQAGLVLGGAAALYLTREQTTEAVAHVAEFVSTKCRPAVDDVMDQVRGAAKRTRVSVSRAASGVKAAARGEGDLIG